MRRAMLEMLGQAQATSESVYIMQQWRWQTWTEAEWWRVLGSYVSQEGWAHGVDKIRSKLNFHLSRSEIKLFYEQQKFWTVYHFLSHRIMFYFCPQWHLESPGNMRRWRNASIISRLERSKSPVLLAMSPKSKYIHICEVDMDMCMCDRWIDRW